MTTCLVARALRARGRRVGRLELHCVSLSPRAPAFSRFVMIRPIHSARPRSSEHRFCRVGSRRPFTTIRTYIS
jgi:hypothetical protein